VHLFGAGADMPRIAKACASRGVPILEDAAQAIGTRIAGRQAGQWGTCAAWSTFPSKNLGGAGDGGFFSTSDAALAQRVRLLRNHGQSDAYRHETIGGNFRLDALQCAILRVKLRHLDGFTQRRRANALRYAELFARSTARETTRLPQDVPDRHTYHQYVVYVAPERRDALKAQLVQKQVGCAVYYPLPFHLQPCFASLGYRRGDFPVAERLAASNLALPIFPELTPDEQREVVAACE
jgi:dTDP-4-amino-4,6-dideoxygalactose transaminase